MLLVQWNVDQRSTTVGFGRIRTITRRATLMSTVFMAGWILPLLNQYNGWQFWIDLLLFNNSVVLIFAFTAVWYEFFVLSWEVHRIKPMSILAKTLWWAPAAFCLVFFNVHLLVASLVDNIWPRIVLYWIIAPMGMLYLIVGWIYTCQLTRVRRWPVEEYPGSTSTSTYKKYRMIARLHYSVTWASFLLAGGVTAAVFRARNLEKVGFYDKYFSLYMDDTLAHFCAVAFQAAGLLLTLYAGWAPANPQKAAYYK